MLKNRNSVDQEFNRTLKHLEVFNRTNLSRLDTVDLDDPTKISLIDRLHKSQIPNLSPAMLPDQTDLLMDYDELLFNNPLFEIPNKP